MNNVEKLVLQMIGEDVYAPDVFTDTSEGMAQIRDSINDCIEEISIITGGYRESYLLPIRGDRSFYRLDYPGGSVAWISGARLQSTGERLEQTDLQRLRTYNPRWLYNTGRPRAYFPIGLNHIGVWPRSSADSDIIELFVVVVPARYTSDTDRLIVRKNLEWAAVHYAVGEYYASRGDAKSAVDHHTRYARAVGLAVPFHPAGDYVRQFQNNKEPWPRRTG